MGDDWCRMRVITDDLDRLRELINETAENFQRYGSWFIDDLHPLLTERAISDAEQATYREKWLELTSELEALIAVEDYDPNSAVPNCHRMTAIGRNPLFPGEWRIAAYRCFMPDEVPQALAKWQQHHNDVQRGIYDRYLFEWYLYDEARTLKEAHELLSKLAASASERSNAWASRLRDSGVLEKIGKFNVQDENSVPLWAAWEDHHEAVDESSDSRYSKLHSSNAQLAELLGEWNRLVPKRWKVKFFHPRPFRDYYAVDWGVPELFSWIEAAIRDKRGLWLWV